ncbi:MAG: hypothetical protein UHX00_07885 [Caryophanon sp.]|nr:hypothetical protein [Caryophanon sp.]
MRSYLPIVLLAATLLGIFNQHIAYFIHNNIFESAPIYYVTACTMISVALFITALVTLIVKKHTVSKHVWLIYIIITPVLMLLVSAVSVFITLMWWG